MCIICHTSMRAVAYSATQAVSATLVCMQCLVCHTGMHTVALCATYACIPLHNMSCRHARKCMICHTSTRVAAQYTTHSRMQWQNPPHIHASSGTSFTHPIRYSRDARAREPQNEPGTACGDACLFNIVMNHLVQPATRRISSISNCWSKAANGKWRFHRPRPHILCSGGPLPAADTPLTAVLGSLSQVHTGGRSGRVGHGQGGRAGWVRREQEHKPNARYRNQRRMERQSVGHTVITVWWQVRCLGHTPPQTVEFAPPPPLATVGRADGVSQLTN